MRENDSLILNIEVVNLMIFALFSNAEHIIGLKYFNWIQICNRFSEESFGEFQKFHPNHVLIYWFLNAERGHTP